MTFNRILVAINSLARRDAAFEHGLALARRFDAELYLLHAVDVKQRFSYRAGERRERMTTLRRRAEEAGLGVQAVEQIGDPAEIIELHATARAVDLIVMGAEARRGWGRDRSIVAERVVRRIRIPTLIVASGLTDATSDFRNVLVAVDLAPASREVVDAAVALAADAAELTVVHAVKGVEAVNDLFSPALWIVPEYRTHVLNGARQAVQSLVDDVPAGIATHVQVSAGAAASTILDSARNLSADLIVVGGSAGFKLRGGTALRVLRNVDRALLVVPSVTAERAIALEHQRAA